MNCHRILSCSFHESANPTTVSSTAKLHKLVRELKKQPTLKAFIPWIPRCTRNQQYYNPQQELPRPKRCFLMWNSAHPSWILLVCCFFLGAEERTHSRYVTTSNDYKLFSGRSKINTYNKSLGQNDYHPYNMSDTFLAHIRPGKLNMDTQNIYTHRIHVWYIYLHLLEF